MENGTIPIVVNPQWGKALQFVNIMMVTIRSCQQLIGREAENMKDLSFNGFESPMAELEIKWYV